jgi:uncharacterized phiE125 gp8 family phage protein
MKLTLVTAPADEPFLLEPLSPPDGSSLMEWLNVVRDDETELVRECAIAARQEAEVVTDRRFIDQVWDLVLPGFPAVITLPYPPLRWTGSPLTPDVAITYRAPDGTVETLDSDAYEVWAPRGEFADPAEIRPAYEQLWPQTACVWNAVTVRFGCGYGASFDDVPAGLRKVIARLTEEQYRVRGVTITSTGSQRERPVQSGFTVRDALMPYRVLDAWWREAC